jgi:GTPase Era involved in 16S rRNA processing
MSESKELVPIDRSVQWCLLSHTNIGKTTLTRTLMADDVGEIDDAAHVTTQSQRYLLQKTQQGDELWLWDTPGFGDSVRLYERLRQQGNPLGWFLSNVWDRWRDRSFYLSQRALLAARDHADVMLYLVNAAEDPADAGYWSAEMNILAWLNKPVIVLLNQITRTGRYINRLVEVDIEWVETPEPRGASHETWQRARGWSSED